MKKNNLLNNLIKLFIIATNIAVILVAIFLIYKNENMANKSAIVALILLILDSILYFIYGLASK